MHMRKCLSMNKEWRFHRGDVNSDIGSTHAAYYGFCKAGGVGGPVGTDWNDGWWEGVDLPHDWVVGSDFDKNAVSVHGYKNRGIGWYRKSFFLDPSFEGKNLILEFGGISTYGTIYFNGSVVKRNWNGYNSFFVDISDRAFYGGKINTLAVKVDAECFEGWWYEGAGIYRPVCLHVKEPLHIAHLGVYVRTERKSLDLWDTTIEVIVENGEYADTHFKLISSVINTKGDVIGYIENESVCRVGEQVTVNTVLCVQQPKLWDLDNPELYIMVNEIYQNGILVDREETSFGYRTIKVCPETGFYLNDKPVKIKGTCNHQDHAGVGVAVPAAIQEYRIQRLKEMGSNAYRAAHGNTYELKDICDRIGMLLIEENRVFESSEENLQRLAEMVKSCRNHPSIIMYSICNEEDLQGTPVGGKIAKKLVRTIKKYDNTRPVMAALNGGYMEDKGIAHAVDVTGINYNIEDYDAFHRKYPMQPLIGSENNSALSTRGVYVSDKEKQIFSSYDEEKCAWGSTVRENWKAVQLRPFVIGSFVWTGFDYRGEPTPYEWPSISSHFGTMDTCGFPKDSYYLHKACWTDEPMVHIVPHWNWEGFEGKPVRVMSHTNCDETELFLNGESMGKKSSCLYKQAEWQVDYNPGTIKMIGYRNGIPAAEASVHTADRPIAVLVEPSKESLLGDGMDALAVNICAIDKEGHFVPTANHKIKFLLESDGRILGVGNGDPNCHEPDISLERSLYNGRCQAIIQSLEGARQIRLRVEADGLQAAETVITIHSVVIAETVKTLEGRFINKWRMTQKVFSERPDPNMETSSTDMNTWEPIEIGFGPQEKLEGQKGYALYRTHFEINEKEAETAHNICFDQVMGMVEVYVNGKKNTEADCTGGKPLTIPIKKGLAHNIVVSVLIKFEAEERAGICGSVIFR